MIKTHASLFSGIGGAELAAEWTGWDNVFHCEINPFGRRVLEYWYPNSKSYEDITKTDFSEWRGKIGVLTGGFPCFVAGTPVLTDKGFIPIEEVRSGDNVLSTDGQYHEVECVMTHNADEIMAVRAQGMFEPLKCTPNHPFYVRRKYMRRENGRSVTAYAEPEYIPASELKTGDKVGYPVHEGNDRFRTLAFWRLVGTYIAHGYCDDGIRKDRNGTRRHRITICCGKEDILRTHFIIRRAGYRYTLSEDKSTYRCIITDRQLCEFLQDFGKYAHGKHLTPQCFKLDNGRKQALLEGWFTAGYTDKNGTIRVATASSRLAIDMAQIARDVYKRPVSINRKARRRITEGKTVNKRPQYCLIIPSGSRYGFYADGLVWCSVKSIERHKENNKVYNLSVYEEHSYNAYGLAVHNCQPFSFAGERRGAEDDRYLWPQMLRAIREIQPSWIVGENVNGILTMVQPGSEAEMGRTDDIFETNYIYRKEQEYVVETVCKDLERAGYAVQPFVIPACAVGAPHRRDRVWFIARRVSGAPAHTARDRDSGASDEAGTAAGRQDRHEAEQPIERGEVRAFAHTDVNGDTARETRERAEGGRRGDVPQQGERRDEAERPAGLHGFSRPSAHTEGEQGELFESGQPEAGSEEQGEFRRSRGKNGDGAAPDPDSAGRQEHDHPREPEEKAAASGRNRPYVPDWDEFPTQPPVCGRDDGVSMGLVGITFPKWRAEAVKALGNSFVPQVLYEIFKSIQKTENDERQE